MSLIKFDPENPHIDRDIVFTILSYLVKFRILSQKTFTKYQLNWQIFRPRKGDF